MLGKKYGMLTVIELVKRDRDQEVKCVCDCGVVVIKNASRLRHGKIKGCGLHKFKSEKRKKAHDMQMAYAFNRYREGRK